MKKLVIYTLLLFFAQNIQSQVQYSSEPLWYKTYDVKFYSINLDINDTSTYVSGSTLIKAEIKESTDSLVFEFNPQVTIDSVLVGKQKVNHVFRSDFMILKGMGLKNPGTVIDILVHYKGYVGSGSFFSSVTSEKNAYWNIPVTWTLSEPFGAKNWFPCKQQLTDKADSCWVFLTVPKGRKAGSNGLLVDTIPVGKKVQYRWKSRYPVAYYLISFTVADYKDYSFYSRLNNLKDSVLIQNYVYNRPGFLEANKTDIDRTSEFIRIYSKLFGEYPFKNEKYGHCVAPIGGGMEHQTMTTLVSFDYTLVAHELAHQWFGNNTTCATWQDILINEGFASYAEYLAFENLGTKEEANAWMISAQNRALREPEGSVFIPISDAANDSRIFSTNLSYKKGAVIIHMLRHQINNDTLFFKTLREFLKQYKYSTATGEDFKNVAEQVTGMDLDKFFNQWYYGKGYPVFDLSWKKSNDTLLLNVKQTPSSKSMSFFSTPFQVKLIGTGLDTTIRLEQVTNSQLFRIKVAKSVNNVLFDPDKWLLKSVQSITQLPEIPSDDSFFEVKPNPFDQHINIFFNNEPPKDGKISILAINGSVIYETSARKKKESVINTSSIKPGTYLLVVTNGNEKYVRKITKVNIY